MVTTNSADRLRAEAKALRDEALSRIDDGVEAVSHFPGRADDALRSFGDQLKEIDELVEQVRQSALVATNYIRARPYKALGVAVAIGLVAGVIARRR